MFLDPKTPLPENATDWNDDVQIWKWARKPEQQELKGMNYDMKFQCKIRHRTGRSGGKHYNPLNYSLNSFRPKVSGKVADVYLHKLQNIDDYVIILPRRIYELGIPLLSRSYLGPEFSRMPFALGSWAVHVNHLPEAIRSLFDSEYINPTTGLQPSGCKPDSDSQSLWRWFAEDNLTLSTRRILKLWDDVETQGGAIPHANKQPPLIYDFRFELWKSKVLVEVEHKVVNNSSSLSWWLQPDNKSSPLHSHRLWHFLVVDVSDCVDYDANWLCLPRHKVHENGIHSGMCTQDFVKALQHFRHDNVRSMLTYMDKEAKSAMEKSEQILQRLIRNPQEFDIKTLINSNTMETQDTKTEIVEDHEALDADDDENEEDQVILQMRETLCRWFNEECRRNGELVMEPLDLGHPEGDLVVIEGKWTEKDKLTGNKPIDLISPEASKRRCVVLRLFDMKPSLPREDYPLWTRSAHWKKARSSRAFLIVGCVASDSAETAQYLLFPSEFTMSGATRTEEQPVKLHGNGEHYVREMDPWEGLIDSTQASEASRRSYKVRVEQGEIPLLKAIPEDPVRYIHLLSELHACLCNLLHDNEGSSMSLAAHIPANVVKIQTGQYRSTVKEVHQVAWDFGLTRNVTAGAPGQRREEKGEPGKDEGESRHKGEAKKAYGASGQGGPGKGDKGQRAGKQART